jgi:hypothetical protein
MLQEIALVIIIVASIMAVGIGVLMIVNGIEPDHLTISFWLGIALIILTVLEMVVIFIRMYGWRKGKTTKTTAEEEELLSFEEEEEK